jgi:hypothetical protein
MDDSQKKSEKQYKEYTIEEVMAVERDRFVIQVGDDLLSSETGKMAFSKERVEELYDQVLEGLNEMKKSEVLQEKEDALACLQTLRIIPLRIH